jgi:hypothetical protein
VTEPLSSERCDPDVAATTVIAVEPTEAELNRAMAALQLTQVRLFDELSSHRVDPGITRDGDSALARYLEPRTDAANGTTWFSPLCLLISGGRLLLVSRRADGAVQSILDGLPLASGGSGMGTPAVVVALLLAGITEAHRAAVFEYDDIVDELEDLLWSGMPGSQGGRQVWLARRVLSQHRRILANSVLATERLSGIPFPALAELGAGWEGLVGGLRDEQGRCDALAEMVNDLFDTFYAEQAQHLSESSRRLGAGLAVVGVPTGLAGLVALYPGGLNGWTYLALVLVLGATALLLFFGFRRHGWL